jgi:hypothetical protein
LQVAIVTVLVLVVSLGDGRGGEKVSASRPRS